jgi:biopolymer transport protein ExbD
MTHVQQPIDATPMAEMNTTPLIDVMLVLLIMFIVTIPIQTHAVKLDLPSGAAKSVHPTRNRLVITEAGAILWNGQPVTKAELRATLAEVRELRPTPELHLQPEPQARYELVDEVLAISKTARIESMGFVGNEKYATF